MMAKIFLRAFFGFITRSIVNPRGDKFIISVHLRWLPGGYNVTGNMYFLNFLILKTDTVALID